MSVVLECLPGSPIFCIRTIHARPDGSRPDDKTRRIIQMGDRLTFVRATEDRHFIDHPARWQVTFAAADGTQYTAIDSLFVTEDHWHELEEFFRNRLAAERLSQNGSTLPSEPVAVSN